MNTFKYADEKIKSSDILIAIPAVVIGIGILPFPRTLAKEMTTSDGWIPILIAGIIVIGIVWGLAKLASQFPNQSFMNYASSLVSKPVAKILTVLYFIFGITLTSLELRSVADVSHQYLFDRTPMEVIILTFLFVVVYAVSGSRAGLFRLNALFLPFIFCVTAILVLLSIGYMEVKNLLPVFKTDMKGYLKGISDSGLSFTGVSLLLFYIAFVKNPKKAPKMAVLGMSSVVAFYIVVYITCIAVFGDRATEVMRFPIIEVAKTIEVPGGFFERVESIFFVIWLMSLFTTTAIAYDIAVLTMNAVFPKVKKVKIVFILSPIVFFIATIPDSFMEIVNFAGWISYYSWGLNLLTLSLLWIAYWIKGGKQHET
ncbi:GerAB/ArcD/ProY family transporter [Gracilibacillus salinarum]|uniref:Spore germination protein n=1 Tax=Gracilibacillus salinarum TaxID=2932255 RepID=A0ABY4GQL2_9BACI|nr:endospore germination permease [Gracilibacillus salinarum]UOQ86476.1 spore germination protein [Gracilibacillus salinarum]